MNNTISQTSTTPCESEIQQMLIDDTFRNFVNATDRLIARIITDDSRWLPRIPQCPDFIQQWALTDNPMLLFTDVTWKFNLEDAFPGITAWLQDCRQQGNEYRQSTEEYGADGTKLTWVSNRIHLNDDCWMEWQMLRELASPPGAHRLTPSRRSALRVLDWCSAKELIEYILGENDECLISTISPGEFEFTPP
jgi:hypothetical protein